MSIESRAPETVVARIRPHARVLFWPTVALLLIIGTPARKLHIARRRLVRLAAGRRPVPTAEVLVSEEERPTLVR